MKINTKTTFDVKEFYFELFDSMHSKDNSFSWIRNLLLMLTYPSREVLMTYLGDWINKNHFPVSTISKMALA